MTLTRLTFAVGMVTILFALKPSPLLAQAGAPAPKTITRDIPFTSHDGYPMVGRLTLPDTPGVHPVLLLVQTAEAATKDGELRNAVSMPVGLFQGELDHNTPAAGVRALEQKAKAAGKTNLEFRYFDGLDHGLGTIVYFNTGKPSAGYAAIFEFMKRYR